MRTSFLAVIAMGLALAGCRWMPTFHSSHNPEAAPTVKAEPGIDFGVFPEDYQLRTVEAFQAKWPNDIVYKYRFEQPRRVQITYSNKNGYAVRFRAQKAGTMDKMPEGFPWVAFFEYGKILWVQRDSEVANSIKWYDGPKPTVDWPPAAPESKS